MRKITGDDFGFVWIATQDGLNRFDGKEFIIFNSNSAILSKRTVGSDFHDFDIKDNCVYAATSYGGINIINAQTNCVEYIIDLSRYLNNGDYLESVCISEKKLFAFTKFGQLVTINIVDKEIRSIKKIKNNLNLEIIKTHKIGNTIWITTKENGLLVFNCDTETIIESINKISNYPFSIFNTLSNIIVDSINRVVYVFTDLGLIECNIKNYKVNTFSTLNELFLREKIGMHDVKYIDWYKKGVIISTNSSLLYANLADRTVTRLSASNMTDEKIWLEDIQAIYVRENTIYTGNTTGIIHFNSLEAVYSSYSRSSVNYNDKIIHATNLCAINDSIVYCCDANKYLYKVNLRSAELSVIDTSTTYYQTILLPDDQLIFSAIDGFRYYKNGMMYDARQLYPCLRNIKNDFIIASKILNDSVVLMASQNKNGIYIFNTKEKKIKRILNDPNEGLYVEDLAINNFFKNSDDEIIVVSEKSIAVLNFKKNTTKIFFIRNVKIQKEYNILMDVAKVGEHYFFAAYGDGVIETDGDFNFIKQISSEAGILNNGVYKIYAINDTSFICSSNNGLYIYETSSKKSKKIGTIEGLQSDYFEETSGFKNDNNIFFGGKDGFTCIKLNLLKKNQEAPILFYTKFSVIENENRRIDTFNLKAAIYPIANTTIQTSIYFSAINFSNPERTTYQYRITEQSSNWISLNTQNFITLIGLAPGTYHLQVKAANEDGVWSEPKELILIFLPKWYQTWWFKLLVLLTTAGIIYAFYRYRIRQIEKQHAIRKNIATDLHDDLGSTLNSVKVFTNLAISGVKQEESLQQVKDNLTEATMSLRDMIWVLDDSLDTVDELVTRLKQFAFPITAASNMEFIITAGSDVNSRTLTKEEKRNLFLICKEAINNSIKYSGASKITVDIQPAGKKIQISVADNGKGFDEATVKKGYGLKNIQYRAAQIKYKASLVSLAGKGTQVEIKPT